MVSEKKVEHFETRLLKWLRLQKTNYASFCCYIIFIEVDIFPEVLSEPKEENHFSWYFLSSPGILE